MKSEINSPNALRARAGALYTRHARVCEFSLRENDAALIDQKLTIQFVIVGCGILALEQAALLKLFTTAASTRIIAT